MFLYLAPAFGFLSLVYLYPVLRMFQLSFERPGPENPTFVGLGNYKLLFADRVFIEGVKHNILLLINVPILLSLSILFAILLYERMRGWKVYRFTLFLPYVVAIPVVGIVFGDIYQLHGVANALLKMIGLGKLVRDWLGDPALALPAVMSVIVWKQLGFGVVLLFSRLVSLAEDLFDAAKIDGCSWLQIHRYVTIPQLRAVIEFYVIISIINMLSWVFNYVFVITNGGPGTSTTVTDFYIYRTAFLYNNMNLAVSAAVVLLLVTAVLVSVRARTTRQLEEAFD